jgi:hypothetical protein
MSKALDYLTLLYHQGNQGVEIRSMYFIEPYTNCCLYLGALWMEYDDMPGGDGKVSYNIR